MTPDHADFNLSDAARQWLAEHKARQMERVSSKPVEKVEPIHHWFCPFCNLRFEKPVQPPSCGACPECGNVNFRPAKVTDPVLTGQEQKSKELFTPKVKVTGKPLEADSKFFDDEERKALKDEGRSTT